MLEAVSKASFVSNKQAERRAFQDCATLDTANIMQILY
jgi:hypothetical protein